MDKQFLWTWPMPRHTGPCWAYSSRMAVCCNINWACHNMLSLQCVTSFVLALWSLFSSTSPTKHIILLKVDIMDLTYICHGHFHKYGQALIILHCRSCRTLCTEGNRGIGLWSIEVSSTLWVDAVAILIGDGTMRLIVID